MGGFSWEVSDSADADDDYSPEEIRLFGKYELGKLLGYGAFGKVYHARSLRTGQSVAIKAVSKQKVVKRGFADNLKREITVMRRLHHHPNVVKLHEVLATKSKIYFVMEFAKGGGLVSKVDRHNGPLPEDLSRRYFRQLIAAVGFCHERGVFHRDLKLENLLLDEDGNLKISDFGLSAVRDQMRPDGLLHTVCGTPSYVAPEILKKKGYDGAKADIWSCGVILFVLTAGYLPFRDSNLMALYRKICKGEFRQPIWTSPDLKLLISRLLDTNPDTRITVDEILRDPWFTKGYNQTKRQSDNPESPKEKDQGDAEAEEKYLNAFDLISLSPGFDLSRLFNDSDASARGERIVSAGTPEEVMERVEEVAMAEEVTMVKKNNWGAKLEGQNGNFAMRIEIYRLTDKMVMVEVEGNRGPGEVFWTNKMKPLLDISVSQPRKSVSGN